MLPRFPAVTRCLSLAALCVAGPVAALEFPLPPPGEDIIGQVQVIKAKYEDTFADLGIDITDTGFWELGLQQIETQLDEAEKLAKKLGKIK